MTVEVAETAPARLRKVGGGSWETLDGRFIVRKIAGGGRARYAPALTWWVVVDQRGSFAPRSVSGRHTAQRVIAEHIRDEAGMGT